MAKNSNTKRNFLVAGDWFDTNFFGSFLNEELVIKEKLNEKTFRLTNEQISSRVITHWHESGILSDDRPEGKGWRNYSFSEMLWISIIIKLRNFGLDLNKIKKVKENLDLYNSTDSQSKCALLDFYIAVAINSKEPIKLIVFANGECELARQSEIDIAKQLDAIQDDYIDIDISRIVSSRIKNSGSNIDYLNSNYSPIEKEIRTAIELEEVHSLSIKVIGGDEYLLNKEYILSTKQEMNSLLHKLKYAEATTLKRGNKVIYKVIEKKKINNK